MVGTETTLFLSSCLNGDEMRRSFLWCSTRVFNSGRRRLLQPCRRLLISGSFDSLGVGGDLDWVGVWVLPWMRSRLVEVTLRGRRWVRGAEFLFR
ncbi:hypothetical protein DY000_02028729 [Brassica cretica]|uniref:Uncharacterized protein n=1 Tax=Brassica cretica TaxID=69181 RepID=A0ABQ7DIJ4_BRACR|nr:hypothetical protein DY000_02028729 [Brassica cretica]